MPWCTCPMCSRSFAVSISRELTPEEWLAKHAKDWKPGEAPRVLCLECWQRAEAEARKGEPTRWPIADVAELCRRAAALGILDRSSMEEWATGALDVEGAPPMLADLATSSHLDLSALSQLFDEVPGEPDRRRVAHAIIGTIGRELVARRIDARAACTLAREAANIVDIDDADRCAIDALDDGLALAEQGIHGDLNTVRNDAVGLLGRFSDAAADLPVRLAIK